MERKQAMTLLAYAIRCWRTPVIHIIQRAEPIKKATWHFLHAHIGFRRITAGRIAKGLTHATAHMIWRGILTTCVLVPIYLATPRFNFLPAPHPTTTPALAPTKVATPVPESSSVAVLVVGIAGLIAVRRKK